MSSRFAQCDGTWWKSSWSFIITDSRWAHSDHSYTKTIVVKWIIHNAWRRHQMETFSALLAICAGNSSATGEFPAQRPVTRSFDVFFDLRLNKRLRKQSWGWWFETPSCPLWRHCNEHIILMCPYTNEITYTDFTVNDLNGYVQGLKKNIPK